MLFLDIEYNDNAQVMKKAFDEGWGGVICKTMSLDSSKVGFVLK